MSAEDWTEEREDLARRYRAQGYSAAQVAKMVNTLTGSSFSRNAVIGKLIRMNAEPPAMLKRERGRAMIREATKKRFSDQRKAKGAKSPEPKAISVHRSRAPSKGITAIRFIDRKQNQCSMFCEGEEGALGFVCGAPTESGPWCERCHAIVAAPRQEVMEDAA
jgi:hypothetical protein